MNRDIWEKLEWAIIGWAIWDSMWLPVEMKTRDFIREKYWRIIDFEPTKENIFFGKWWFKKDGVGYISDDTCLTLATLEALSDSWKIDFSSIATEHIRYHDKFPYWFWKSTRNAVEMLRNWASHRETWNTLWTWNWIMMKQAPLAFYYAMKNELDWVMNNEIREYAQMTHNNRISAVSAVVHNKFLLKLILSDWKIDNREILSDLLELAREYEREFDYMYDNWENISDVILQMLESLDSEGNMTLTDDEILEKFSWWDEKIYKSCYIRITLPIVYSLFLRNPNFEWLLDSINIWWDVDSFAAIMWNMIWAYLWKFYPEGYPEKLQDLNDIKEAIGRFRNKFSI